MDLDRVTVLDISRRALDIARQRLGTAGEAVARVVGDVTRLDDLGTFEVWRDRAVLHFLTDSSDCRRYVALCERTVEPGGVAVMATFAPDGPEMCSGLPVHRYDAQELSERCGSAFELVDCEHYVHETPAGVKHSFIYSLVPPCHLPGNPRGGDGLGPSMRSADRLMSGGTGCQCRYESRVSRS